MTPLDIFALVVLIIIVVCAVGVLVFLAMLPGKLAKQRNHPQADAINIAGIVGLFTFGVVWVIAVIWAFMKPPAQVAGDDVSELRARIEALEAEKGPTT